MPPDEAEVVPAERPCGYTTRFLSVIGYGRARMLEAADEELHGLRVLMRHHGGPIEGIDPAVVDRTAVVEIVIESMDGKRHDVACAPRGE
jgi:hypothetical protein